MGFLVGNDYIPPFEEFGVYDLPIVYRAYIKVLPTLDGYLNDGGQLNRQRFIELLKMLVAMGGLDSKIGRIDSENSFREDDEDREAEFIEGENILDDK